MRLRLSDQLLALVDRDRRKFGMRRNAFFRALLTAEQGRGGIARSPQAAPITPFTDSTRHRKVNVVVYVSEELLAFTNGLCARTALSKNALMTCLLTQYLGIAPLGLDARIPCESTL